METIEEAIAAKIVARLEKDLDAKFVRDEAVIGIITQELSEWGLNEKFREDYEALHKYKLHIKNRFADIIDDFEKVFPNRLYTKDNADEFCGAHILVKSYFKQVLEGQKLTLEEEFKKQRQLDFALQQFEGYVHGKSGYGIPSLAAAMGLEKEEWEVLRDGNTLSESDKEDLDFMFKINTK